MRALRIVLAASLALPCVAGAQRAPVPAFSTAAAAPHARFAALGDRTTNRRVLHRAAVTGLATVAGTAAGYALMRAGRERNVYAPEYGEYAAGMLGA